MSQEITYLLLLAWPSFPVFGRPNENIQPYRATRTLTICIYNTLLYYPSENKNIPITNVESNIFPTQVIFSRKKVILRSKKKLTVINPKRNLFTRRQTGGLIIISTKRRTSGSQSMNGPHNTYGKTGEKQWKTSVIDGSKFI